MKRGLYSMTESEWNAPYSRGTSRGGNGNRMDEFRYRAESDFESVSCCSSRRSSRVPPRPVPGCVCKIIFAEQFLLSLARTALTLFRPECGANFAISLRTVQHREPGDNSCSKADILAPILESVPQCGRTSSHSGLAHHSISTHLSRRTISGSLDSMHLAILDLETTS